MKRFGKVLFISLIVLVAGAGIALGSGYWLLRGSLPVLVGDIDLVGLSQPVTVHRDELGIATVVSDSAEDRALAVGFLHGQERFFQMDLMRRSAAGELAAVFGAIAIDKDKELRIHRFRHRAKRSIKAMSDADQRLLTAYSKGVNQGLQHLAQRPFEYWLLGVEPEDWLPEDCALVAYSMYLSLQKPERQFDSAHGLMRDVLPQAVVDFLVPIGTDWDAPLLGEAFSVGSIPGPEVFDLRTVVSELADIARIDRKTDSSLSDDVLLGSNNWAVSGAHTASGGALLANDMHLGLRVPNTWYRLQLSFSDHDDERWEVNGVTLPGLPSVVVGSNGRVAWGLTNAYGDWQDWIILNEEAAPAKSIEEWIEVKGADPVKLSVLETAWGPVIDTDYQNRSRALRWVAHDVQGFNIELQHVQTASSVAEALQVAQRSGMPALNFVAADREGHIGWTIAGPIPLRGGRSGAWPQAATAAIWQGWLPFADYPRLVDPSSGRLWTANARVVSGAALAQLGSGNYALGTRAWQIRDRLFATDTFAEADMLAIQLDDYDPLHLRWRELLLNEVESDVLPQEWRDYVREWDGRVTVDSVGFRIVRAFRLKVSAAVFAPLNRWLKQHDERFEYRLYQQYEGPLWHLVQQQPAHFLSPRFGSWSALFNTAFAEITTALSSQGRELAGWTWGEANTLSMRHPLSRFIPLGGALLDMPAQALPGGIYTPRVQRPDKGASQRIVVEPGRDHQGILHMPGGQSGHPLSPFYRAGHDAWVRGEASALLPGATRYSLHLR